MDTIKEKRPRGRPRGTAKGDTIHPLTEEELARFFRVARRRRKDLLLFNLTLFFGLRSAEVAALRLEDFDRANLEITVAAKKRGRRRTYCAEEVPGDIWRQWRAYMKVRKAHPVNPYLFPARLDPLGPMAPISVQCTFKAICRKAGISNHSVHDLRHTCGQRLARMNFSATRISRWLRQKSSQSAEVYITLEEDKELGRHAAEAMPIYS